jgi:hypothetical protein
MKKEELKRKAVESAQKKAAERPLKDDYAKPAKQIAKVTAVSLYGNELAWLDQATKFLARAGVGKPNRSEVIREAIQELREALDGKDELSAAEYFRERRARRASAQG